jgi:hypothetical protein
VLRVQDLLEFDLALDIQLNFCFSTTNCDNHIIYFIENLIMGIGVEAHTCTSYAGGHR